MAHTIVASATREWIIGDDKPFTVIGERLNPTNRKTFIEELAAGNYERVERDALSQTEAGAHMLVEGLQGASVEAGRHSPD